MLQDIIKLAQAKGFSDFQITRTVSRDFGISLEQSQISSNKITVDAELSFKGIYDGKAVFGRSENESLSVIENVLDIMVQNAKLITISEPEIIYEGSKKYPKVKENTYVFSQIPFEKKLELVRNLETECQKVKNLKILESCNYAEETASLELVNTKGLSLKRQSSYAMLYPYVVIEKDGEIVDDYEIQMKYNYSFDPIKLAHEVDENVNKKLGACKDLENKTGKVIFAQSAIVSLLGAFSGIFSDNARFFNQTKLADKLGQKIASSKITLIDNACYKHAILKAAFDSEGVAHQENVIIDKGVFKMFLNNLKMSQIYKEKPTGNAGEDNSISFSNLYIANGKTKLDKMLKSVPDGTLYIKSLSGIHAGVNHINGDFSLQSNGFVIRNGKLDQPYRMAIVTGNFFDLLKDTIDVADDMEFTPKNISIASPSLLVDNITVVAEKKEA